MKGITIDGVTYFPDGIKNIGYDEFRAQYGDATAKKVWGLLFPDEKPAKPSKSTEEKTGAAPAEADEKVDVVEY